MTKKEREKSPSLAHKYRVRSKVTRGSTKEGSVSYFSATSLKGAGAKGKVVVRDAKTGRIVGFNKKSPEKA